MSIFSNIGGSTLSVPVIEGYGVESEGALVAVAESFQDRLAVMEAVHAAELINLQAIKESGGAVNALEESGYVAAYESAVSNVFEKIKAFFKKLWQKIKSFFHALRRRFDLIFKDAISFVEKYESELKKLKLTGMKAKTFDYTLDKSNAIDGADKEANTIKAQFDTFLATAKNAPEAKLVDAKKTIEGQIDECAVLAAKTVVSGVTDIEDYEKSLYGLFRGGAKGPEDKVEGSVNIATIISEIKSSKSLLRTIDNVSSKVDKRYGDMIKAVTKAQTEAEDVISGRDDESKKDLNTKRKDAITGVASKLTKAMSGIQGVESKFFSAWRTAVEERNSDYKSIIGKALKYKEKKD